jgi:hypothetical protein
MQFRSIHAALSVALAAVAFGAAADAAKLVGTQGMRSFVVVSPADAASEAALKQAAASVCKAGSPCQVLFWSDPQLAASKMPLSPAQQQAIVAQYSRNPGTGQETVMLKCKAPDEKRCLK